MRTAVVHAKHNHCPTTGTAHCAARATRASRTSGRWALSLEATAHFNTFGFCVLPNLFSPAEAARLETATLEVMRGLEATGDSRVPAGFASVDECLAGRGAEGWSCGGFYERHPLLTQLLEDERVHGIPAALLGEDYALEMTDGHIRHADTAWHGIGGEDVADPPCKTLRVCFYFSELTRANGCVRDKIFMPDRATALARPLHRL